MKAAGRQTFPAGAWRSQQVQQDLPDPG